MKAGLGERIRERLSLRWSWRNLGRSRREREQTVIDEIAGEFTTEELQEFLEADLQPVRADPEFKEALRSRLWDLVQRQHGRSEHDEP